MPIYFLVSFLLTAIGTKLFLLLLKNTNILKKKDAVDNIKKPCIKELHKNKLNTYTMGGLVMNTVLLLMTAVYYMIHRKMLWLNLFILLFGIMGFIDDYIKLKKIRDGVKPREKLAGLTIISIFAVTFLTAVEQIPTELIIPFLNINIPMNAIGYSVIMVLLLVTSANSVNLTDGLDGLALGIAVIVFGFIGFTAWKIGNSEILYSTIIMLGICLGMLIFNHYPAKIFMGDTGSLFLGGAIALFLIKLNIPLWIILVLAVCLWETLSVVIQLTSLRLTGKRMFHIAPYHHHLEKCGWKETRIVPLFWTITLVFCLLGWLALGGALG